MLEKHAQPHQYGFQTTSDGTILRTDPLTGTVTPIYQAGAKPSFTKVGTDPTTGQDVMCFVDQTGRKVRDITYRNNQSQGPSTIPPVPAGVDPKIWRESFSKNAAASASPANFDDVSKLRSEIANLPSYKNLAQAAPIYNSMFDAAGRNTKAADLNMVYGLGKIMDPGSVVREGEIQMAKDAQGWQEKLNGMLAQINNKGALTPEGRQAIMQKAHSRIQSYKGLYDQDAKMFRGIAERNRANPADVLQDFGEFKTWTIPTKPNSTTTELQQAPQAMPKSGEIQQGYRFKGGNPSDPSSWERVQ